MESHSKSCRATKIFPRITREQVIINPESTAIVSGNTEINYKTLNLFSNQFARYLRRLSQKFLVAVCVERSPELIVSLLAIMKSGAAYLPLDPELPSERIQFMLQDSQAKTIITQQSLQRICENYSEGMVFIDKDWGEISQEEPENLSITLSSSQLAYVIYTSRCTGKPKGVEIRHKSLTNFLTAIQQKLNISNSDCWLASTTISFFDISNLEIFLPLTQGAKVVLADKEVAERNPSIICADHREIRCYLCSSNAVFMADISRFWMEGQPTTYHTLRW